MENQVGKQRLADPREKPGADIVIYDGQCRFCTREVQRLARWDGKSRLTYLSLHDPRTADLCPDLTHDQLMQQMHVLTPSGQRFAGAAAVRHLSLRLPRLWFLAPLLHLPWSLPVWQWAYMRVAKRRYRLGHPDPCDTGDCDVPLR